MGRLRRIEDIINGTINHYSHLKIMHRGLPRYVDTLLRGDFRFGRRTGNDVSLINPDNTFELQSAPQTRDNKIQLQNPTSWIVPDCIISMGPSKELQEVDDIVDNTIIFKKQLTQVYTENDLALLHSYPMLIAFDCISGSTQIVVKSHYPLVNGDVFVFLQTDGLLQSYSEIEVSTATVYGTSTDPFYTLMYSLDLKKPITRNLLENTIAYIRAYPAYISKSIQVPTTLNTSEPMGPFIIDFLSGRLVKGTEPKETFAIKTATKSGQYNTGDENSYVSILKNHIILKRPISAHVPMFWELAEGTMRITSSRTVFRVNPDKRVFSVGCKCIPKLPSGFTWRVSALANDDCTIRFNFSPNVVQEFSLNAGISTGILVSIPTGDEVDSIEINISSSSDGCYVQLGEWNIQDGSVDKVEYTVLVPITGIYTYQCSGLILKPYFLSSDSLKASYDSGATSDGGKVYF